MTTLREAAQQALAFIRWTQFGECRTAGWDGPPPTAAETDAALVAALAQPEQEPVARKPLTEEEAERICLTYQSSRQVVRAVERAHGIKE